MILTAFKKYWCGNYYRTFFFFVLFCENILIYVHIYGIIVFGTDVVYGLFFIYNKKEG